MNIRRKLAVVIVAFGSLSVAQAGPVAGQIYEFDGHYYSWINSYISWDDAVAYAESYSVEISGITLEDWHLVTITSAAENDFIWNTVLDGTTSMGEVWLGGIVTDNSIGNFEWITGEEFTYSNFALGNPSHERETVLEIGGVFGGPLWNDEDRPVGASLPQTFVIEHSSVIKPVAIDIKPGSCPNSLNCKSKGVLPVAILGTVDFDVTEIDPATVRLAGVAPLRWDFEDVATPYEPFTGKQDCTVDCTEMGPDGYMDATLKFDTQEVIAALGEAVQDGACIVVQLTGNLRESVGGTEIVGEDVICIKCKGN